jgi:release factor glutamine methyltransferase
LVPRPETEGLFELAARMVRNPEGVVDLCTGSGALALALKHRFPNSSVFAPTSRLMPSPSPGRTGETGLDVHLLSGDLFDPLPSHLRGQVDLVVANPPYVAEDEFDLLPRTSRPSPGLPW